MMRTVVIGLLGTTLDRGSGPDRWNSWRPSVSICQQEDLLVSKFDLLIDPHSLELAKQVAADIALVSPETKVQLHELRFRDPWDFVDVYGALHDFAREYPWDTDREEYLFHITTGTHVAQICTFLLTESRHYPGRLLQTAPPRKSGSSKPGRLSIIDLDLSKYDRMAQRFANEHREATDFLKAGIATQSPVFNRLIEQIEHVAINSSAPILLMGPTGAGKSSLARRIFELKKLRRSVTGNFVEVNCATIRGDSAMSTLFGHKRGAFTGAATDRAGLLREADQGILFLDEIGELGPEEQAMLLRAVEERRFYPLGSDREVQSSFQLICGTNRMLGEAVRRGNFREELFARINLWTFELPGLAQRREDIAPNIEYELAQLTVSTGRMCRFNKEAKDKFISFANAAEAAWTGNFRDLNAAIARMATFAIAGRITVEIVDAEMERLRRAWRLAHGHYEESDVLTGLIGAGIDELDEFDRVQLAHVVEVCRECPTLAAAGRRLFAASRARKRAPNDADRLRKYLARFSITFGQIQELLPN